MSNRQHLVVINSLQHVLFFGMFFFLIPSCLSKDADSKLDSIRILIQNSGSDTLKINAMNSLAIQFSSEGSYDSALKYCDEAISLAEQTGFRKGLSNALSNKGLVYGEKGNYPEALKNYQSALEINKEIGDKKATANSYNNIANTYHVQGDFPNALKNQLSALKIREEIGDKEGIAWSYNNIGIIYRYQGDNESALKNYTASLKILEELGNKKTIATAYNNIGNLHSGQGEFSEALRNYFISLRIRQEINHKRDISTSYNNIGDIFCDLYEKDSLHEEISVEDGKRILTFQRSHWLDTAVAYQSKALSINKELDDKYFSIFSLSGLGRVNFLRKNYTETVRYYRQAYELAAGMKAVDLQKEIAKYLSDSYTRLNDFRNGMYWFEKYSEHKDSLFNEERTQDLTRSQMKYEFEKSQEKERAIQEQKDLYGKAELDRQKKMRNIFIAGFGLVLLFAGVFFYQRNNIRKEKARSDELLLNILPSEIAGELKQTGSARARRFDEVTVMFTDFVDFTKVSERIRPEELVDEIHTCFSAFDNILQKYRLEKIKTIGDAYLCAAGLPTPDPDHAVHLAKAALEIMEFMHKRKEEKKSRGEIQFELRIGIHTGPVVAGIVGVKKYAYDIWGDTVNIAARMEENSEPGKINISKNTFELVKNTFKCTYRGKIEAKNKGEIDMYFLDEKLS